jgi:hypothetical protein
MDTDVTWRELNSILRGLKNGSAANPIDGLPPEFFKLATERDVDDDSRPECPLGVLLLRIVNLLLNTAHIPMEHNTAVIVSFLKKNDGDSADLGEYRGISLIAVLIKIVTTVVYRRVYEALESRGYFRCEQAGFRTREECVAHIVSLREIIESRRLRGLPTFVAFLDIKKAYDSVPHEAMIRKLELAGVSGKCLQFVRALYETSAVKAKGNNGMLSSLILMLQGERQGCPGSPLFFNIFINDIFDQFHSLGVKVLCRNNVKLKVPGLLLADDAVILASTAKMLRKELRRVTVWADTNLMEFGIAKCGIMGFGPGAKNILDVERASFFLQEKCVPVVEKYKYLGVTINDTFQKEAICREREAKGQKAYQALKPLIWNLRLPSSFRVMLIRSVLLPTLTWACELWGMQENLARSPQKILDSAVKGLVRLNRFARHTGADVVALEFDVPSIHQIASAARTRAYFKYPQLKSVISKLMEKMPVSPNGRGLWALDTAIWLKRYSPLAFQRSPVEAVDWVKKDILAAYERSKGKSAHFAKYSGYNLCKSRQYVTQAKLFVKDTYAISCLHKVRTFAVLEGIRLTPNRYLFCNNTCPCCLQEVPETIEHMIVTCPCWRDLREECGVDSIVKRICQFIRRSPSHRRDALLHGVVPGTLQYESTVFSYLVGGTRSVSDRGVFKGWVLPRPDNLRDRNMDQLGNAPVPLFVVVARYCNILLRRRLALLRENGIIAPARANAADDGMAALLVPLGAGPGERQGEQPPGV